MDSREHSGVRASVPPVDYDGSAQGTSRAAVNGPHESSTFMGTPPDGLGRADPPAGRCEGPHQSSTLMGTPDSARYFAARGRLGLTRRGLLGAAVAVGAAFSSIVRGRGGVRVGQFAGSGAQPSTSEVIPSPFFPSEVEGSWPELFWRFRTVDFARAQFEEASSAKAYGPGRRPFGEQGALEGRFGEVVGAVDKAMLALLEAPAPDLEALALKISLIGDHNVWELEGGEDCLVWLEADARRLAGAQAR